MGASLALALARISILLGFHKPKPFFSDEDNQQIVKAIAQAEDSTSAEIRVHLSGKRQIKNIMQSAQTTFNRLGMHKTAERNGVLIFLVPESHQFVILGDEGINSKVCLGDWDGIRDRMQNCFRQSQFKQGVILGIHESGELLAKHFEPRDTNPNELSNQISTDA